MRTSEERVQELHRRMIAMEDGERRRAYLLKCAAVYAMCFTIVAVTAFAASRLPVSVDGQITGSAAASIFAEHASLGYVAVALMAFCLGALTTIFCFRMKKHMKENRNDDRKL